MIRLLALVGCLLAGALATEVVYQPGADRPVGPVRTLPVAAQAAKRDERGRGSIDRSLRVVLARPLFAPDRKPVAGAMAADPAMPRLTGIIALPDGAVAIFQPAGNAKPIVAQHGDAVGGWEVTMVSADSVDLRKAEDRIVLTPRFGNVQSGAPIKVKTTASRWEVPAATGFLRERWSNAQLQP
jgi:hypothetical protein